jgi:EAL domain-containing protein (putative c-di-GMP-specific phosphodiesterase class I)
MLRPRYVSDAIEITGQGLHIGRYGRLRLYSAYQPIFRLQPDGLRIEAWEGLIRPEVDGRRTSPGELFEQVDEGDHLFVECMCRALHLRNYRNAGETPRDLFINVNPAIYESVDVIEREFGFMFSILDRYGLAPHRLVCELVEEEALSTDALVRVCALFRARGARIALDDFGTGSSGPERYAELRPEIVKVDGMMFRHLSTEPAGRSLLSTLARSLLAQGTELLVEGIETPQHLSVASDIGATLVQGYGIAAPQILPYAFADGPAVPPAVRIAG